MKNTIFTKIIEQSELEIKTDCKTAIERLKAQQGICRETDSRQVTLEFLCHDDGRICVCNYSRNKPRRDPNRLYSVIGQVTEENGKTKVKIYSLFNRTNYILSAVAAILYMVVFALYFVTAYKAGIVPGTKDLYLLIFSVFAILLYPLRFRKQERDKANDLYIMKQEIIKRVNAIDKWDK